ncbi:Hypothetical predicted protein, partial [Mytilus galloprovincialis]
HQEEAPGYPTQLVPSGARYPEIGISNRTEVYEFRSTELYDARNCQIPLPRITEKNFGIEESYCCDNNTANSNIRGMPLTHSRQMEVSDHELTVQDVSSGDPTHVVPSGARYINLDLNVGTEIYVFQSTEPYDPRNCRIPLSPITEETFGIEESTSCYYNTANSHVRGMPLTDSMQVEPSDPESGEESRKSCGKVWTR